MRRDAPEIDGAVAALVLAKKLRVEAVPLLPWGTLARAVVWGAALSAWLGLATWWLR